eukprot:TRINITY_DN6183_c0_g1_i1.p1 TRINITY_DN6183_c0_g1~~TRINITY_DN6183_c0_g1_i1.p1  ORF type:complete len:283 (-),score=31.59 TRINITY_DN6183_c0_g1_i1:288-1136(-)
MAEDDANGNTGVSAALDWACSPPHSHPDRLVVFPENYSSYLKEWDGLELRVAVCGLQGTGKSSLILRYSTNDFSQYYDPTVEESCRSVVGLVTAATFHSNPLASLILDISDTMPQYDWNDSDAVLDGLILCFDLTHRPSFDHVAHRLNTSQLHHHQPHQSHNTAHPTTALAGSLFSGEEGQQRIPTVIVATKLDLIQSNSNAPLNAGVTARAVTEQEAQQLAQQYSATYVETSSLTGDGVSDAFASLIRSLIMATYQSSPAHVPEHQNAATSAAAVPSCSVS